jgi:hypothetical protein
LILRRDAGKDFASVELTCLAGDKDGENTLLWVVEEGENKTEAAGDVAGKKALGVLDFEISEEESYQILLISRVG